MIFITIIIYNFVEYTMYEIRNLNKFSTLLNSFLTRRLQFLIYFWRFFQSTNVIDRIFFKLFLWFFSIFFLFFMIRTHSDVYHDEIANEIIYFMFCVLTSITRSNLFIDQRRFDASNFFVKNKNRKILNLMKSIMNFDFSIEQKCREFHVDLSKSLNFNKFIFIDDDDDHFTSNTNYSLFIDAN